MTKSHTFRSVLTATAMLALMLSLPVTSQAQGNGKSFKFPVSFAFNPCVGEPISLSGTMNMILDTRYDKDGCAVTHFHRNFQNVTGTGLQTGNSYRVISISNQQNSSTLSCDGCTVEFDLLFQFVIIGEDGKSYTSHSRARIILNLCTFEFETVFDNSFQDCD